MFKIPILVIRQDFVWISSKVAPIMCPVVLVQDETGFFLGTHTVNPIYVGSVPIVTVPYSIMNQGLFATSTPLIHLTDLLTLFSVVHCHQ